MAEPNHPTKHEPLPTDFPHSTQHTTPLAPAPTPPTPTPGPGASPTPHITTFTLGPFQTNCYLIHFPGLGAECWIIDASYDPDDLIEHIRTQNLHPTALILTHAHCDHMAGITAIRTAFPALPIRMHSAEKDWLSDPILNLSALMGQPVTAPEATDFLEHNQLIPLQPQHAAQTSFQVIHTPGHSPGGIALHHAPSHTLISGDALFAGSIGRTDFPGSDHEQLLRSIRQRLYTLPTETKLYPGHGPPTTIGRERLSNPFVRG